MYDQKRIKESFVDLVGLRQTDNPEFGLLSPSLLYTGDNVLIQHPLVNIENLDMTARNYSKYVFPAYVNITPYVTGDRVLYNGVNYEAKGATTGNLPIDTTYWKVLNLLDLYLQDIWTNAAEDVVNDVITAKKLAGKVKTIMSSLRLYSGAGNMEDLIVNEGALVGVQIRLLYNNNILAILERIGLQLSVAQENVTFYLFHSSQTDPIATLEVNQTQSYSFQWHDAKLKMNYLSDSYDAGGVFFLVYDQAALTGQAIKKTHNFHLPPCGWCNAADIVSYAKYNQYVSINSIKVKAADRNIVDPLTLWDITKTMYTVDTNYGLNMEFTVRCDITDFLIQQKDQFQYAMRDMVTLKLLETMANSTRQNSAQTKLDVLARAELTAPVAGGMGFKKRLEDAIKAVDFEFGDLDAVCIPCGRQGGVGYGVAGLSYGR